MMLQPSLHGTHWQAMQTQRLRLSHLAAESPCVHSAQKATQHIHENVRQAYKQLTFGYQDLPDQQSVMKCLMATETAGAHPTSPSKSIINLYYITVIIKINQ